MARKMKPFKSTYYIHKVIDNIVYIVDTNGSLSVTNDAESVCETLNNLYPNHRIIYRDSMGVWDELIHCNGVFTAFKPYKGEIP